VNIDKSVYVHPTAVITGAVTIGKCSNVWPGAVLRADFNAITVGEYTTIQDGAILHPTPVCAVTVGNYVTVSHNAVLHACVVENDVMIGMNATVLDGAVIGEGSLVAANAVVLEGTVVPPNSLVVGVPGTVKEGRGRRDAIHANAVLYSKLAQNYIAGRVTMSPEEIAEAMRSD